MGRELTKLPILDDDDAPELTPELMAQMRPLREANPTLYAALRESQQRRRGAQKQPTKVSVTLRLEREIVAAYRATGRGWQTRVSDDLAAAAKRRQRRTRAS